MLGTEVCRLLALGLSIKEAAGVLKIEPWQAHEALEKQRRHLKCKTTFQLIYRLTRLGLRSDGPRDTTKSRAAYFREWRRKRRDAAATTKSIAGGRGLQPEGCDAGGETGDAIDRGGGSGED